ncbi:unnamed protein product [Symbiodinium sp. CCMP2592]|nr:unnamed protein product [Symbiodinium sp. CCMP2592]
MASLRRAAFDIGSGATKLVIADVIEGSIQELFAKEVPVPFAVDWKQSSDGSLSSAIQEQGVSVLRSLLQECEDRSVAVHERVAVATEVFRKASNGKAYLERVFAELALPVRVLSQDEEAELGFRTAAALARSGDSTICWDSGGASFQITTRARAGALETYLGCLGTGVVTSMLVEIQGHSFAETPSPNPVRAEHAEQLLLDLKRMLPATPSWLRHGNVAAIGGPNSMFCVACEALGMGLSERSKEVSAQDESSSCQFTMTAPAIRDVMLGVIGKSDDELLQYPFCQGELREPPAFILPKLLLLLAVMEHCEMEKVFFYKTIGSCPGMLISDEMIFARTCARKGAKVVMLNRSSHRADEAFQGLRDLAKESKAPEPLNVPCDLMSFKSVRSAAEKLQAELGQSGLDVLCNNAGIMGFGDKATEDGCDVQMQTNHLSHFLLTCLCMPLLEKAASLRGEARVVNHSSAARAMDGIENKLQEKYLGKNGGNLGGDSDTMFKGANFERYQQSKLANVVFTYALHDRLQKAGSKVKSLVAHPGVAATELAQGTVQAGGANDFGSTPKWIGSRMISFMGQSEEDATVGILRNACDPEAKSGEFYGPLGKGGATGTHDTSEYNGPVGLLKKEPLADEVAQSMLWAASEATTGIKFDGLFGIPSYWKLVFTGHSLGAALAILAATMAEAESWPRLPDAVIAFAAPRVGDKGLSTLGIESSELFTLCAKQVLSKAVS